MQLNVKQRLLVGFGGLLVLLATVTVVGQKQLATIQHFNTELDERAFRLSLAGDWATQIKVAVAAKSAVPSLDSEAVKKLGGLIKADEEKQALDAALRSHTATPEEHSKAVDAFNGKLVSLQISDSKQLQAALDRAVTTIWACLVVGIVFGVVMALRIAKSIVQPLTRAIAVTEKVASGDLTDSIDVTRSDEVGQMLAALAKMQGNLSKLVTDVRHGSESVATASTEIAQGNNDLSIRTEQQASALQTTASSMAELNSTVRQNADSARQANQLAMTASTVAVRGGDVVGQVVETMKDINDSSRKIGDIISVIDGIAFQTNILALNAAVEAARAGEQGRGFAVVASEVRALAGRSAEAAKEIKALITASVEKVEHGTTLVDQAGETMTEVVASIRRVTDIMGEISAASEEQSARVAQVGEAAQQMDHTTQQNAALVEEMAAAASSLKSQAQDLVQIVAAFKVHATGNFGGVTQARVRSAAPPAKPFAGTDRRTTGVSQGAAARKPAATAAPAKLAAAPVAAAKKSSAAQDDDWETF
ncbi:methyl-accepting chemotaxis protein [Curvibacter sp. APW13]|uniref:methyl-accepting chemotaxis protein n=1 Tax=Curvibacter sp. APW13 TaxID=3077236 RepID=UPI0028DE6D3C|nr:methyl-accepting chemotaxis protein [Curvibacter sp. APW13]MDT8989350.1 methyl-accepting chemotaxis protein [Curvibacter sp. APW13]